jgi:hypothetical protein
MRNNSMTKTIRSIYEAESSLMHKITNYYHLISCFPSNHAVTIITHITRGGVMHNNVAQFFALLIIIHTPHVLAKVTFSNDMPHYESFVDFIHEKPEAFNKKKQLAETILRIQPLPTTISQTDAHLLFSNIYSRSLMLRLLLSLQLPYSGVGSLYQVAHTWWRGATEYPANTAIKAMLAREYTHNQRGHYVLYHATTLNNYAMHYIDTALHRLNEQITHNKELPVHPFLILRQPSPNQPQEPLDMQTHKREQYIKNGVGWGWNAMKRHQRYLMSCNYALSGNNARLARGESSLEYWLLNFNLDVVGTIQKPFDLLYAQYPLLEPYAKNYTSAYIDAIKKLRSQATCGVMLQIIFKSPDAFRACTYTSRIGGYKTGIWIQSTYATDPVEVLHAITHTPYLVTSDLDTIQFRLVLTNDFLLNPSNPRVIDTVEMYGQTAKQEALEAFDATIQSIMQKIADDQKTKKIATRDQKLVYCQNNGFYSKSLWHFHPFIEHAKD